MLLWCSLRGMDSSPRGLRHRHGGRIRNKGLKCGPLRAKSLPAAPCGFGVMETIAEWIGS